MFYFALNIYLLNTYYLHKPLYEEGKKGTFQGLYDDLGRIEHKVSETVKGTLLAKEHVGQDESYVFSQLMKRVVANQDQCGLHDHSDQEKDKNGMPLKNALEEAINEQNSKIKHESCYLPPTQICADGYTTIISYHNSQSSHRTLFINIIALMARDSASNKMTKNEKIILIYHGTLDDLKKDKDYGRRVWDWSDKGTIDLINGTSTDHGILHQFHPTLLSYVNTEIILFIDGSIALTQGNVDTSIGGVDSLEAGFELIQQNSRSVVGAHVYDFGVNDNAPNSKEVSKESGDGLFAPACETDTKLNGMMKDSIVHYSGMFLHKNYLCFIWHDLFRELQDKVNMIYSRYQKDATKSKRGIQSELISLFISSMVPQLGGNVPLVYPLLKPSWKEVEKTTTMKRSRRLMETNFLEDNKFETPAKPNRRRRTEWDVDPYENNAAHFETEHIPRRGLSIKTDASDLLKPPLPISLQSELASEEILSISTFFGSYSKRSQCWCESKDGENSNFRAQFISCRDRCSKGRNITKVEIPWIKDRKQCH